MLVSVAKYHDEVDFANLFAARDLIHIQCTYIHSTYYDK